MSKASGRKIGKSYLKEVLVCENTYKSLISPHIEYSVSHIFADEVKKKKINFVL